MKKIIVLLCVIGLVLVPSTMSVNNTKNTKSPQNSEQVNTIMFTEFDYTELMNVSEVDYDKNYLWQYGGLKAPHDAERLPNGHTLIAEYGKQRIIEIDRTSEIIWEHRGGGNDLFMDVERLDNGNTLISDYGDGQVTEINNLGEVVWQIEDLHRPMDAERLPNGNTLIAQAISESANSRSTNFNGSVIEFDSDGNEVWKIPYDFNAPTDAERLPNGNTLVTEHVGGNVTEFDNTGAVVWQKSGLFAPTDAERHDNGNTLIAVNGAHRIIETDPDGKIIWQMTDLLRPVDVEILFNPSKPIYPSPKNGAINIATNPYLSVEVNDPDGEMMDITFFNAFDDSLIGTVENVESGETVSVQWDELFHLTEYSWYVKANDGKQETRSDTWSFTTVDYPPLPTIEITHPKEGFFYFKDQPRFSLGTRTIIYGPTTIKLRIIPSSIEQLEKVEIKINGKVEKTYGGENHTIEYEWAPLKSGQYTIKTTVYDRAGQNTSDSISLFKWRFHPILLLAGFVILFGVLAQL
jgi:hypothetical protein